jgi:hypothetical protein
VKCEYCDSVIKTVPDNGICPNCGGVLPEQTTCKEKRRHNLKFPEPPIGTYEDVGGFLKIEKDSVTFYRRRSYSHEESCITIPFNEIYAAHHLPASFFLRGVICVRRWEDRYSPPSRRRLLSDKTLVFFNPEDEHKFIPPYQFLKKCAEIVNQESTANDHAD